MTEYPWPDDDPSPPKEAEEGAWGEGLRRSVLAYAMRGDLLSRIREGFDPDLFGSPSSGAPMRRIATCIAEYWKQYASRPTAEIVDELVKRVSDTLSAPERAALEKEWTWLLETELPENPQYIYDQVVNRLGRLQSIDGTKAQLTEPPFSARLSTPASPGRFSRSASFPPRNGNISEQLLEEMLEALPHILYRILELSSEFVARDVKIEDLSRIAQLYGSFFDDGVNVRGNSDVEAG